MMSLQEVQNECTLSDFHDERYRGLKERCRMEGEFENENAGILEG